MLKSNKFIKILSVTNIITDITIFLNIQNWKKELKNAFYSIY